MNDDEAATYDELGMLEGLARHEGIAWRGRPRVERTSAEVGGGQQVSALVWGAGDPEIVCLHGGGQNAHTWDAMAMVLDRPLVAFDLPGHGHSDWREDRDYDPPCNAEAIASAMDQLAPHPRVVAGMSLGGLTAIRLAAVRPDLVPRAVVVDVTPGVAARHNAMTVEEKGVTALIGSRRSYGSFEELLGEAAASLPGRTAESLRPGVLHNARRRDDGRWIWRYDLANRGEAGSPDFTPGWEDLSKVTAPIMLVRGGRSLHVHADDIAEFVGRHPDTRVEVVEGAGHSVQSSRAGALAALVTDFVAAA